jgi:peptidoglycan/LPS O-acetylase OafA/YrhL
MPAAERSGRIGPLDGLRGLAAIVVVVRHTLNAIAIPDAVLSRAPSCWGV